MNIPDSLTLDPSGKLYVVNGGSNSVSVFAPGSSGDTAPVQTIATNFNLDGGLGITVDSSGRIYLLRGSSTDPNGAVNVFAAGSYALGAPEAVIGGSNTGLYDPFAIALNQSGTMAALNLNNTVTVYPPGSRGNVTPSATIDIDPNSIPAGSRSARAEQCT